MLQSASALESRRILVMGVSGSGKSMIGEQLAKTLGCDFFDGDDFHPQANIDKMSRGEALNDDDRAEWLERLKALLNERLTQDESVIIACSALKARYRELLRKGDEHLIALYLDGSYALIHKRMSQREGHFFASDMLASQFKTLEPPHQGEAYAIDISLSPEGVVDQCLRVIDNSRVG
ncbi:MULTISPECIES: gluconokinase [Larsenimonas]|uniref:Gluconokinase n=1 Tax=Larsenimonas suaedae TaxID=1851019 RepID=A0ABU1GW58_9GAMM|nr:MULTISPECIES: gluconokinase [Larsenimonas]MCM2972006.1 gluconokinase [Larsenimonas suaedae]MCM5705390.1 gluconokinase [Larsenimonas salina]MDR5895558.1 gluconokinase [Larsenimonas suaedae]